MRESTRAFLRARIDKLKLERSEIDQHIAALEDALSFSERVETALAPRAAAPAPAQPRQNGAQIAPIGAQFVEIRRELTESAGLKPLTTRQAMIFHAVEKVMVSGFQHPRGNQNAIARECGYSEGAFIVDTLHALSRLGYVQNIGMSGRPNWRPLVEGEIALVDEKPAAKEKPFQQSPQSHQHLARQVAQKTSAPAETRPPAHIPKSAYPPVTINGPLSRRTATDVIPVGATTVTQQLLGRDGNGGRSLPADAGKILVTSYLIRKGHTCNKTATGWIVDGKMSDRWDVLELINGYREKAEVPPVNVADLE